MGSITGRNKDIRQLIRDNNIYQWQVADELGIFISKLRDELTEKDRQTILAAIDTVAKQKSNEED